MGVQPLYKRRSAWSVGSKLPWSTDDTPTSVLQGYDELSVTHVACPLPAFRADNTYICAQVGNDRRKVWRGCELRAGAQRRSMTSVRTAALRGGQGIDEH
jgi:hypothetical protein